MSQFPVSQYRTFPQNLIISLWPYRAMAVCCLCIITARQIYSSNDTAETKVDEKARDSKLKSVIGKQ